MNIHFTVILNSLSLSYYIIQSMVRLSKSWSILRIRFRLTGLLCKKESFCTNYIQSPVESGAKFLYI
ncbi:hypothetical protein ODZ84_11025 [Chryseobacterium fluminis]|uniref:hypothetical protein n=1 Tax=Chryseobacterium fluminis TaxID=2983606 RepID=UPI00224E799F|nr:hypothetical protein [Chryseobacterium sp. MMS21-Ot14]UZU00057.1 hypothetical protein ODZ84_11025 [Chryseobacterium sp. MMS21-Ot14]